MGADVLQPRPRDALLDDVASYVLFDPGTDRGSDGASATRGTSNIGEGAGDVASPKLVFAAVAAIGSQPHMCRVSAAGDVALMAQHRVIGVGPAQPRDDTVFELVREQMRRHGPAARRPGQARRPEGTSPPGRNLAARKEPCPVEDTPPIQGQH